MKATPKQKAILEKAGVSLETMEKLTGKEASQIIQGYLDGIPATRKQIAKLRAMGYYDDLKDVSSTKARELIEMILLKERTEAGKKALGLV